jgi:hypothetical protein
MLIIRSVRRQLVLAAAAMAAVLGCNAGGGSDGQALAPSEEVRQKTEAMLKNKAQERAAHYAKQKAAMRAARKRRPAGAGPSQTPP